MKSLLLSLSLSLSVKTLNSMGRSNQEDAKIGRERGKRILVSRLKEGLRDSFHSLSLSLSLCFLPSVLGAGRKREKKGERLEERIDFPSTPTISFPSLPLSTPTQHFLELSFFCSCLSLPLSFLLFLSLSVSLSLSLSL